MRITFILLVSQLVLAPCAFPAQTDTPLARSIAREAAHAAATLRPTTEVDRAPRAETDRQSDWSRVSRLEGDDIVLSLRGSPVRTLEGSPSGRRTVVRGTVTETGLTVLNLTDPSMPRKVRGTLMQMASAHPEYFGEQGQNASVRLNRYVRLEAGAVLIDNRPAAELQHVIERIDRNDVAEISRVHRNAGKGAMWGALVGEGIAVAEVFVRCGTHWNTETSSCGNLTGIGLVVYPLWGSLIGAAIGAANETTTVVYRAP